MKLFNLALMKQGRGVLLAAVAVASVLSVGLIFSSVLNFKGVGGSLTAYLIGSGSGRAEGCWGVACTDRNSGADSNTVEVVVRLANPTNITLRAYVAAYFGRGPLFVGCAQRVLGKNSYAEVNLINDINNRYLLETHDFTVKVLTVNALTNIVQAGVKGWITHFNAVTLDGNSNRILLARESQLQGVPIQVAQAGEAERIISDCNQP